MRRPNTRRAHPTNISSREIGPLPWRYFVVIAICGGVLAAGFFLAARQHFDSMQFGMNNSQLRKQLEDLESENRRLLLAREVALSPAEITKTARNLGFLDVNATMPALPVQAQNKPAGTAQLKASGEKSPAFTATPASVTMTAYQRPVKSVSSETPKRVDTAKPKTIKPEITAIAKLR